MLAKLAQYILKQFYRIQRNKKQEKFNRVLPFADYLVDRWEKAKFLNFDQGASIYDSATVIGEVQVGENTWVGPNVMLDGSGDLAIGKFCSISAGVQIYTHDSVAWALSGGKQPYEYAPVAIGDYCYIGPNTIIQKGINIGEYVIVGANSFVNKSIPAFSKAYGSPIKIIPLTAIEKAQLNI